MIKMTNVYVSECDMSISCCTAERVGHEPNEVSEYDVNCQDEDLGRQR